MLDFARLQSQLRRAVAARISAGQISGNRLARLTDFKQPHITNFLREKRGLSFQGADRILRALEISALDLIPERELERFVHAGSDTEYEAIPLVDASAAHLPFPPTSAIRDWVKFKRSFLRRLRANAIGNRENWLRFVLMQVADEDAMAMYPRIQRGAMLLVDRHYNGPMAYRTGEVNVYVVRVGGRVMVRAVDVMGAQVVLRPENSSVPLEMMLRDAKQRYAQKIAGRVCWQGWEM